MKRFFTKSKVAFFIVISIAVFCFAFNIAKAQLTPSQATEWATLNAKAYNTLTSSEKDRIVQLSKMAADDVYNVDGTLNPNATPAQLQAAGADLVNVEGPLTPTQQALDNYYKAVQAGDPNAYDNNIKPILSSSPTKSSSFFDPLGKLVGWALTGIAGIVTTVISVILELVTIPIASIFLGIAGKILDFTIQYTINGASFGTFASIINGLWVLIRDIFNIAFIFILLYIAITKILGSLGPKAKSTLISVIISAVFINFSFFITRIIIDAGNIVAIALYSQIENSAGSTSLSNGAIGNFTTGLINGAIGTSTSSGDDQIYLTEILANQLKIQTIYDTGTLPKYGTAGLIQSFLRLVIILITTFVFFWMIFLLLGRFIMLMFLMVGAPIGFVGGSIPWVSEYSAKWWKSLIDQTILAPVFMFFMLLIIRVAIQSDKITSTGGGLTGGFLVYFQYILIIFLLFKAVEITKKLSGQVGEFANKLGSAATGAALAAATGGTALIARQTIGRGAAALSQGRVGRSLESLSTSKWAPVAAVGKLGTTGLKKTAGGTMDLRNTLAGKETLGNIRSLGGIDLANGRKAGGAYGKNGAGFSGWQEQQKKNITEQAQSYDKSMKEYEDRTRKEAERSSGMNFEDTRKQEVNLQKKIDDEKDPAAKQNFESQLKTLKEQRVNAEANTAGAIRNKAEENVEKKINNGDDPRINDIQKGIADRIREKAELETKLAALKTVSTSSYSEKQKETHNSELHNLEKGIGDAEKSITDSREKQGEVREELIKAEMKNAGQQILEDKDTSNTLKEIVRRQNMRKDFAESTRKRFFTLNTTRETRELGNLAESENGQYKEKTKAEKTLAAALEEYSKKEDAPKPQTPPSNKPTK